MSDRPTVAVLGTGTIGEPVARNLARAGFPVQARNRTRERAAPLAADRVLGPDSPQEAVAGADALITLLSDGPSVEEVTDGAAPAARPGATWIQSGLVFVDASVRGTKEPAEKGELVVFASARKRPGSGASRSSPRSDRPRAGSARPAQVSGSSWSSTRGCSPLSRESPRRSLARLDETDARLVLEAAERAGIELPLVEAVHESCEQALELGHAQEDLAAVVEVVGRRAAVR
ncbi:MAG TPA: NAD(P)-binding domain-containing protein [Gaiellaceae bacterium]|nr:NAD(P)-binding domain-containing protein [Gaiellaceae bacterium]